MEFMIYPKPKKIDLLVGIMVINRNVGIANGRYPIEKKNIIDTIK